MFDPGLVEFLQPAVHPALKSLSRALEMDLKGGKACRRPISRALRSALRYRALEMDLKGGNHVIGPFRELHLRDLSEKERCLRPCSFPFCG